MASEPGTPPNFVKIFNFEPSPSTYLWVLCGHYATPHQKIVWRIRKSKKSKEKEENENYKISIVFVSSYIQIFYGFGPLPMNSQFWILYVHFDLYTIISFQPFTVVVRPYKFYCCHINKDAFNEKGTYVWKSQCSGAFSKG